MQFLGPVWTFPVFPEVKIIDSEIGALAVSRNALDPKVYRASCPHFGAPIMREGKFDRVCKAHCRSFRDEKLMVPFFVNSGLVFLDYAEKGVHKKYDLEKYAAAIVEMIRLPDCDGFAQAMNEGAARLFHHVETRGDFLAKMWVENVLDLTHVAHVHKGGFGNVIRERNWNSVSLSDFGMSSAMAFVDKGATLGIRRACNLGSDEMFVFSHSLAGKDCSVTTFGTEKHTLFMSVERIRDGHVDTWYFANDRVPAKMLGSVAEANSRTLDEDRRFLESLDYDGWSSAELDPVKDDRAQHFRKRFF